MRHNGIAVNAFQIITVNARLNRGMPLSVSRLSVLSVYEHIAEASRHMARFSCIPSLRLCSKESTRLRRYRLMAGQLLIDEGGSRLRSSALQNLHRTARSVR